jgi:hypothetical protein
MLLQRSQAHEEAIKQISRIKSSLQRIFTIDWITFAAQKMAAILPSLILRTA